MKKNEMIDYCASVISSIAMKSFDDAEGTQSMIFARKLAEIYTDRIEKSGNQIELFSLIGNCAVALNCAASNDWDLSPSEMAERAASVSIF